MKPGDIVKFADPQDETERNARYEIVWIDRERMLVRYVCELRIRPTHVFDVAWMQLAKD